MTEHVTGEIEVVPRRLVNGAGKGLPQGMRSDGERRRDARCSEDPVHDPVRLPPRKPAARAAMKCAADERPGRSSASDEKP